MHYKAPTSFYTSTTPRPENRRHRLLDAIRGITVLSMILYHGSWDLVYLCGVDWPGFRHGWTHVWQQSICWTFILLSGFCWPLGRRHLRRGITVFAAGALVSAVTLLFMPEERILFGVLTLLGSAMLLTIPLDRLLRRLPPQAGLAGSAVLFFLTRNVNSGFLGFEGWNLLALPEGLYRGWLGAWLGFPPAGFFSQDYFSIFPWFFLFLCGYFLFHLWKAQPDPRLPWARGLTPFAWIGRHALLIYLLHQPVLYAVLVLPRQL